MFVERMGELFGLAIRAMKADTASSLYREKVWFLYNIMLLIRFERT